MALQIAVLRGENAVAKTLQSAVHTLERDKAQLQGRVHSLEQRLMGSQASEGDDAGGLPPGEQRAVGGDQWSACPLKLCLSSVFCFGTRLPPQEAPLWSS